MEQAAPIINIVLLIALLVAVLQSRFKKQKSTPTPQSPVPATNPEALMTDATQKAHDVVVQAEQAGLKLVEETKTEAEGLEKRYEAEIGGFISQFQAFLKQLEQRSVQSQQDYEDMMKARINELLFSLEQDLTGFLNSSEQKSIESLSLELKSARQLIDSYREQQLKLIDENIVAVLERTIALVLKDKIDLKDQLDLVYEALEKAKIENFFS